MLFQRVSVPTTIEDPGIDTVVVLVDTTPASWLDGDSITLPSSPTVSARIEVKDAEGNAHNKSIVVDGNGISIDGQLTATLKLTYSSIACFFDGSRWEIV